MDLKPRRQIFSKEKFIIATLIHTNGHNRERSLCLPKVHLYLTALHIDRGKGGCEVWHHQEKLVFPVPASRIQQLIEQGLVQVNGKVCSSKKTTVQPGEEHLPYHTRCQAPRQHDINQPLNRQVKRVQKNSAMINPTQPLYANPYYWAGFTVTGKVLRHDI